MGLTYTIQHYLANAPNLTKLFLVDSPILEARLIHLLFQGLFSNIVFFPYSFMVKSDPDRR